MLVVCGGGGGGRVERKGCCTKKSATAQGTDEERPFHDPKLLERIVKKKLKVNNVEGAPYSWSPISFCLFNFKNVL